MRRGRRRPAAGWRCCQPGIASASTLPKAGPTFWCQKPNSRGGGQRSKSAAGSNIPRARRRGRKFSAPWSTSSPTAWCSSRRSNISALHRRASQETITETRRTRVSERLKGKLAFVTAAGQGIGFAIAEAFLAEGASVIATDLAADKLKNLKTDKIFVLDVRSTEKVDALAATVIDKFGAPNILVNCAGYVHQGSVLDCSEGDWDFSFDLNVKSMHRTLRAFVPAMLKNGGGSIINVSSTVSSIRGVPDRYAYGASKAAIIGLTKAVAADFITQGIRCNAICPGTIQSPSLDGRITAIAKSTGQSFEAVREAFIDRQPIRRLGTIQEVAALAVFLASDESSYITGQPHLIDGGMAL